MEHTWLVLSKENSRIVFIIKDYERRFAKENSWL